MEKSGNFFSRLVEQLKKFWGDISTIQKAATVGVVLLVVAGLITIVIQQEETGMTYLYENIDQADLQLISQELKNQQFTDFIIDDKGIKVPVTQVMPLRLKLAQEGLPAHGNIGWEKFDTQDFTKTEFEQNVNKLRATQGELERTIKSINGIVGARVHIVMPEKSLFKEDEEEPTAAVYVKTFRNNSLSTRQIRGITHLVAKSVPGLRSEKIAIINQDGRMLTKEESDDPTTKMTNEMLAYRRTIEKELSAKVKALVARIVGAERVEAKIDVEVDFTREEQTISDIDPDRVVVLSSNTTNQEMSGSGLNPTGIPGAKSNVPGEQEELSLNSNQTASKRNSERLNYEIKKEKRRRILPVGNIKRISAAVIVDGSQIYPADGSAPVFEPRTQEEMDKISDLVKSAIGYKEDRGDIVTVHNVLFELAPLQVEALKEKKKENRQYISTLIVSSVIALALVFFFAFVVRPYFRWLSYDPERKKKESIVEEFKPDLEMGGMNNVQVKEDVPFEKLSPQEQILFLAKNEPARTTEAIRILLNPHQANR
ncbi:MAG: flagellar M-ring protein FliF [Pseudobacteriovorax sp.]|nr:flagellar M-ring protein FliF [Pseudobacteriovorax sp.]